MRRLAAHPVAIFASVLVVAGCMATEQGPREIAHEPEPPAPLGSIERVVLNGQLTRALAAGAPLRLDLEIDFAPLGNPDEAAHLAAELRTSTGTILSTATSGQPIDDAARGTALELELDEPHLDAPLDLDLFVVGEAAAARTSVGALHPRSPVLRAPIELVDVGTPGVGQVRRVALDLGGQPDNGVICDDGRVVVSGPDGVAVLDPTRADGVQITRLDAADAPVHSMIVDWRCARAFAAAGERFVVFDLLSGRVIFDEIVPDLVDVVFDVNPRYVMLLLADGRLRRYYLRDDEWSDYNGRLPATPARRDDGSLVMARGDQRLAIATSDGALCVVVDALELEPRCVTLPTTPVAVALVPFGFADERFAEHDASRASQWFEDDVEARQQAEQLDDTVLGAAVLVDTSRELSVFGLDAGFVAARHTLDLDARDLVGGRHGELVAVGARTEQAVDPLDQGTSPRVDLVAGLPDDVERLWPSPTRERSAWFDDDGLEIAARDGSRLGFVVGPATGRVLWSDDDRTLAVLTADAVYVIVPDGVGDFVPETP